MWTYLISVNSDIEADVIIGLLEEANIPTEKKDPGGLKASYGIINGIEVWVPSELLEQAQELLTTSTPFLDESQNQPNSLEVESNQPISNGFPKPILVSFILILFVLLYWLFTGIASYYRD